ncbi:MAG: response regulator [Verrucomicrobiota bacterium]
MTPHSNPPSAPTHQAVPSSGQPEPNQFRLLIVDDLSANRLILSRLLNLTGYLTFEANDGQQALDCIATRPFDLVIMDLEMPNLNGLEAIRQIRGLSKPKLANLPILAASGNPQSETMRQVLDAGANAFLTKPFDPPILLKTIARLLSPTPSPSQSPITETNSERISPSEPSKSVNNPS